MKEKTVKVTKDFGVRLYGRYPSDGDLCGQNFRANILLPSVSAGEKLILDFEGVSATPSSFFEEAFGGLVREILASNDLKATIGFSDAQERSPKKFVGKIMDHIVLKAKDPLVERKLSRVVGYMEIAAELAIKD